MIKESDQNILIIEDSQTIILRLKEYLNKLGYTKIDVCKTGNDGISAFDKLVNQNIIPIVFLDYYLPDLHGSAVLTRLLEKHADTKVILETVEVPEDPDVKYIIEQGVFSYIQKPFSFKEIKQVMDILGEESKFTQRENEMKGLFKQAEKKIYELVNYHLRLFNRISLARLMEYTNLKREKILPYLEELKSKQKITQIEDISDISCEVCKSVKVTTLFCCPSCKKSNFIKTDLVEHYDCGNVTTRNTYQDDLCPKCNKKINALGNDYRIIPIYACNDCEEKFPDFDIRFLCLSCSSQFGSDQTMMKQSLGYKAISI